MSTTADQPIGHENISTWLKDNTERAKRHLSDYFGGDPEVTYQGRYFEWFLRRSTTHTFTSDDFMAIGALSVDVPAKTAHGIIDDPTGAYRGLLAECQQLIAQQGNGVDLATCPEEWLTSESSPFMKLYRRLRAEDGCGPVVTSKLMAAKFPAIVPIRDAKVSWLLGLADSDDWWIPMRNVFASSAPQLAALTGHVAFDHVCGLRRLDVVLWMEASERQRSLRQADGGLVPQEFEAKEDQ